MNRNVNFPAEGITELTLKLAWASAEVYADRVEDIQILVAGAERDVSELRIRQEGTELIIDQPNYALPHKRFAERWTQVFVRVPQSWKGSIDAETSSGSLNARGLIGTDLTLEALSGSVQATNVSFITISAKTVSGSILLSAPVCEQLNLRAVSGQISVRSGNCLRVNYSEVSGDLALSLVNVFDRVEGNSVSGDVVVTAPVAEVDASLRSVSGRVFTDQVSILEGAPKVSGSSVSGNLVVQAALATQPEDEPEKP